jgi:hypothetical protein
MAMTLEGFMDAIPDDYAALEGIIKIIFEDFPDRISELTEDRVTGWIEEIQSGEGRSADEIRSDIAQHVITEERIMEVYGVDAETASQLVAGEAGGGMNFSDLPERGGTPGVTGVMGGGDLVRVEREDGTGYYALRYVVEGIEHLYSFGSDEAAEQAIGNLGGAVTMSEDTVNDGDTWLLGDAGGMVGQEGEYGTWFDNLMSEAALEAGVRNPGMIGEFLSDGDVMRIMAEGEAGDWSDERIRAEVRNTTFYQDVLYPGISTFLESGMGDPETRWLNYNQTVEGSLASLGYARDEDGSYRSRIGEMLNLGIEATDFTTNAATFVRAEQSPEFMADLAQWYQAETGQTMAFDDWFDVLAGTAGDEMNAIVEQATLQFQVDQTSLIMDPTQLRRLARMTDFSEATIGAGFSTAEQSLLAIGRQNLARFGLTEQDLINAAFNLGGGGDTFDAPQVSTPGKGDLTPLEPTPGGDGDGLSAEEVRRRARKAMIELGLTDDPKAQFFTGYGADGRPLKTGLLAGAPERG